METIRSLPFGLAVATLFAIVMLRANGTYWLGRAAVRSGETSRWVAERLDSPRSRRAQELMGRLGIVAVPLSFLTIGIQTAINLTAGVARMPLRWYLPAVTVGCVMWAFLYATVGMVGWSALTEVWAGFT